GLPRPVRGCSSSCRLDCAQVKCLLYGSRPRIPFDENGLQDVSPTSRWLVLVDLVADGNHGPNARVVVGLAARIACDSRDAISNTTDRNELEISTGDARTQNFGCALRRKVAIVAAQHLDRFLLVGREANILNKFGNTHKLP